MRNESNVMRSDIRRTPRTVASRSLVHTPQDLAQAPRSVAHATQGFSLVEMMVSVLLISIGLLGLAKVQGMSAASTKTASSRGAAAYLTSSLAGAMRANPAYWRTDVPATVLAPITNGVRTAGTPPSCALTSAVTTTPLCSPADQAAFDLDSWTTALAAALPMASATIECPAIASATVPRHCDVRIEWQENVQAVNASTENATAQAGAVRTDYSLAVWP